MIEALRGLTGRGVRVGLVDSGLAGRPVWVRGEAGWVLQERADRLGHGTAAAGVVKFWAPEAELVGLAVLDDHFRCPGALAQAAVRHAAGLGCHLVLLSMAGAVEDGWSDLLREVGGATVVVAASANHPNQVGFPAHLPGCVGVAVSTQPRAFELRPDGLVGAPAQPPSGRRARILMGTSCAAAHLCGLLARLCQRHPQASSVELRERLEQLCSGRE